LIFFKAILCIGVIAANNPECRDFVLQNGALTVLLQLVQVQTPLPILRKLAWTLSILCGVTHPTDKLPKWEWVLFLSLLFLFFHFLLDVVSFVDPTLFESFGIFTLF
jgi:hypothetical protein